MIPPRVVHCKREAYTLYIGSANTRNNLKASKWANKYRIGVDGTREECIENFRRDTKANPGLMASLGELTGQVLGCWCHPDACHGDVLVELWQEKFGVTGPVSRSLFDEQPLPEAQRIE